MKNLLHFQDCLARKWRYRKLRRDLSTTLHKIYRHNISSSLNLEGDCEFELKTLNGTLIATGYDRIVIGDYGAFIEINPSQMRSNILICKPGEEYRYQDERYSKNIKYYWYTIPDKSEIKVYFQKKCVTYADYLPDKFYVSVFEVLIEEDFEEDRKDLVLEKQLTLFDIL